MGKGEDTERHLSSIVFFLARLTHRKCQLLAVLTSVSFLPPFLSFLFPFFLPSSIPLLLSFHPLFTLEDCLWLYIFFSVSHSIETRAGEKERERGASLACRLGRTRNAIRRGQPPCCRHAMPLRSSKEEGVPYRGLRCAGGTWERSCEPPTFSLFFRYVLTYDLINFEFLIGQRQLLLFLSPVFLFCLQYRVKTSIIFYAGSYSWKNWMVRCQDVRLIKLPTEIKIDNFLFLYCREGNCGMECITEKQGEKMAKRKRFSGRRWCRSAFPNQVLLVWHFGDQPPNSCYRGGAGILVRRPDIWYRRKMIGY